MENSDRALALAKAGFGLIPGLGGTIASLIGDFVPTAAQKNTQAVLQMLQAKLDAYGDRLDKVPANKNEFAELFMSCYPTILRTHQETKRKIAVNLIVNCLLKTDDPDKLSYTELDHFVCCLDSLSIGAIDVLGDLYAIRTLSGTSAFPGYKIVFQDLQRKKGDVPPGLLMGLLAELHSSQLVHVPNWPTMRETQLDNLPLQLSELGERFVDHLFDLAADAQDN